MSDPIEIIDLIHHRNKDYTQEFLVLNRWPVFLYEQVGRYLMAEDSGFFNFYGYDTSGMNGPSNWKAFGGRKIIIPLKDGTIIEAKGQWWDSAPRDWQQLTQPVGAGTPQMLARCNVFCGIYCDPFLISNWLEKPNGSKNIPSNNYNKYDKRHQAFGKHEIVSRWA